MRYLKLCSSMLALALIVSGFASPARAQATRTWVSGVGDNANPCSRTAPCQTFAGAITKTAPSGEIDCLDSGGFAALTINKAITIDCETVIAGVLVSGTNGINVAAGPNDRVVLKGLDFEGIGAGIVGISFTSGAALVIDHVTIRDFTGPGIKIANSGNANVLVSDSQILSNTNAGISITTSGALNLSAAIDNVRLAGNGAGLVVNGASSSGSIYVTLRNSVASGNSGGGVAATGGTGALKLLAEDSAFVNNGSGLSSSGSTSEVLVGRSAITGNQTGVSVANGGLLDSYGDNRLNGNVTEGAFTSTVASH